VFNGRSWPLVGDARCAAGLASWLKVIFQENLVCKKACEGGFYTACVAQRKS